MGRPLTIDSIVYDAHTNSVNKGFWDKEQSFPESLALIHSEVSEALEDYRVGLEINKLDFASDGKPFGIPSELADVIIRICDLCAYHDIDIETAIRHKMVYNLSREKMHGKIL